MNICVISAIPPHINDAVGDACWFLAQELANGNQVSLVVPRVVGANRGDSGWVSVLPVSSGWGVRTLREVRGHIARIRPDVILVHFVPQLYGWNGAKPGLALLLGSLKRQGHAIVTVAHEFSAPFGPSPKLMVWSAVHRFLFWMIARASNHIVLTTAQRCDIVRRRFSTRRRDCVHIAIGSTIPVVPVDRIQGRAELEQQYGIGADELVVSTFGSRLGSVQPLYEQFFRSMIADGLRFRVLLIGKSGGQSGRCFRKDLGIAGRFCIAAPGTSAAVSRLLSLSDLYIAFYPDGASAHRTSLLAGLAHGVPTISNIGTSTEASLVSSGALALIDFPINAEGLHELRNLWREPGHRSLYLERGRRFYQEHHSWSQIAEEYRRLMSNAVQAN